jgi:hypothetical protein
MANEYQEFRELDTAIKIYVELMYKAVANEDKGRLTYYMDKLDVSNRRYVDLCNKLFLDNWGRYVITEEQRNILRTRLNYYKIFDPEGS